MGKILTYLGIEEAGQTRDILDAERLLEGMQSLYANSPEGKKKDAFAVPLAEMTKVFIEKVKGIKPAEQPKEKEEFEDNVIEKLVDWFVDFQQFFMHSEEVTPRIVFDNEKIQKKYILWMQNSVLSLFLPNAKQELKNLGKYLATLHDDEKSRSEFLNKVSEKDKVVLEGQTQEFDADLLDNFLGLFNVLGKDVKDNMVIAYKISPINNLNPAFFENLMETSESALQATDSNATIPSFIKPISKEEPKPSKPNKPSKPKPSKIKFEVGDMYSLLNANGETTLTIIEANADNIKVKYADGSKGFFDLTTAESRVKNNGWKKIEKPQEQPQSQKFKVGDNYLVLGTNTQDTTLQIVDVDIDNIQVRWANGNIGIYEINNFELNVKAGKFVKIENEEKPEQQQTQDSEFNVDDVYYSNLLKQNLTITQVGMNDIMIRYDDGEEDSNTKTYARLMIKGKDWVKVEKPQEEQNGVYKVGDKFIKGDNKDFIFTIDFIKYSNIGLIYEDGLTANLERKDFEKGLKSGYYKPYTETQDETDFYFKEDDVFIDKKTKKQYQIYKVNKNNGFVDLYNINSKGNVIDKEVLTIEYVQASIKKGDWIKIDANATKPTKPRKPRTPTTLTEKDKQIKHILDINIDDIDL